MDNIQNKIIYKKTADYDNISSTTNSVDSQIDLDESIISINNNFNNDDTIYTNNNNLMYNINKELTKDLKLNQDNNEDKDDDNEMNKIEDFSNIRLDQVINMENVNYNIDREEQNSFLNKLTTNDINTWIFMGMIIISFLIIIMIIINKK